MARIRKDQMLFEFLNDHQKEAWETIDKNDITFLIGPAGSAKTFLATAFAIQALHSRQFKRCHIARPVIQTEGEDLGFLPGTIEQKLEPYLVPIFECFEEIFEPEEQKELKEKIIEKVKVAPIAFVRGRTFKESICVLDEAQNATAKQTQAWMTRLGIGSKMIVTGDPVQTDIPRSRSKLVEIANEMAKHPRIAVYHLPPSAIVRHEAVRYVIEAFENLEKRWGN